MERASTTIQGFANNSQRRDELHESFGNQVDRLGEESDSSLFLVWETHTFIRPAKVIGSIRWI